MLDVDGVLADVNHRLHHLSTRPKDWAAFFAAAGADPPLAEGLAVARRLGTDHRLIYLSGRPEHLRATTQAWLAGHGFPAGTLVLRPPGDRRPARVTKPQLLRRLARGERVAVVVDDDPQVCDAYEAAGFTVLRADWAPAAGPGASALREAQERDGRT